MIEGSWAVVEWRPVVGFETEYEVSNDGRVRRSGRAARNGAGRGGGARIGRELAQRPSPGGYLRVQLWRDGKGHALLIHRLVAGAFLGAADDLEVNHIDGDKANNSVGNLEWCTRGENLRHAYRTGLREPTLDAARAARRAVA